MRPGWFYHAKEDSLVKAPGRLFDIYLRSVGRGSVLLLNIPPDRRGLFHEEDVKALKGFKELLDSEFKNDLAKDSEVEATNVRGDKYEATNVIDNNPETYWATDDEVTSSQLILKLGSIQKIKYVKLAEYIKLGQRVKSFKLIYHKDGEWLDLAEGTTIGHERILEVSAETDAVKLLINDSKACPLISSIEIY
ncbi:MAG: discoidin domain-containing protein [Bacteroidota bacterium]